MDKELRAAMLAQVEARRAYNALPEDAKDTDVAEARTKLEDADQDVADLLAKEPATAPRELRDKVSLARYLQAIADESLADGAEAELRKELKLKDQAVPLEALMPLPEERRETRADAISPQDASGDALDFGDVYQSTGPMLSRVFQKTDTAFLMVSMPTVPAGERVYPVMTDGTTAAMAARGAAGPDAGAAKFDVVNATPHRLTGSYVFDLEGVATLGTMLESTLRSDLRMVLGEQMDLQVLAGSGAGGNVSGLLTQLTRELAPGHEFGTGGTANDASKILDYDLVKQTQIDTLDGRFARTERDERWLVGKDTYSVASVSYGRGTTDGGDQYCQEDAIEMLRRRGSSVGLSFRIPAAAAMTVPPKTADGSKKHQDAIINLEPAAAVAPVWQGIMMIRDPFTGKDKGQIGLTAHMLFDFVLRRKDGWKRYAFRTEA